MDEQAVRLQEAFLDTRHFETEEEVERFNQTLTQTGALLAGGYVLASVTNDVYNNDMDIYINASNAMAMLQMLMDVGYTIKKSTMAPAYDGSFFRKNGIFKRILLKKSLSATEDSAPEDNYAPPIDLMLVCDHIDLSKVVTNFDLTFCEVWYDGKTVNGTCMEQARNKKGELRSAYHQALMHGNVFIQRRIKKYTRRGFTISYEESSKGVIVPPERKFIERDAYIVTHMYRFILESLKRPADFKLPNYTFKELWSVEHPLDNYTLEELNGIVGGLYSPDEFGEKVVKMFTSRVSEKRIEEYEHLIQPMGNSKLLQFFIMRASKTGTQILEWATDNIDPIPEEWQPSGAMIAKRNRTRRLAKQCVKIWGEYFATDIIKLYHKTVSLIFLYEADMTTSEFLKEALVGLKKHARLSQPVVDWCNAHYLKINLGKVFYKQDPVELSTWEANEDELEKRCNNFFGLSSPSDSAIPLDEAQAYLKKTQDIADEHNALHAAREREQGKFRELKEREAKRHETRPVYSRITALDARMVQFNEKLYSNDPPITNEGVLKKRRDINENMGKLHIEPFNSDKEENFIFIVPNESGDDILCCDVQSLLYILADWKQFLVECISDRKLYLRWDKKDCINRGFNAAWAKHLLSVPDDRFAWEDSAMHEDFDEEYPDEKFKKYINDVRDGPYDKPMEFAEHPRLYVGIPTNNDGTNLFVDIRQLRTLLLLQEAGIKAFYLMPHMPNDASHVMFSHTCTYHNMLGIDRDDNSANHCQYGSNISIYDVRLCGGIHCSVSGHTPENMPQLLSVMNGNGDEASAS